MAKKNTQEKLFKTPLDDVEGIAGEYINIDEQIKEIQEKKKSAAKEIIKKMREHNISVLTVGECKISIKHTAAQDKIKIDR